MNSSAHTSNASSSDKPTSFTTDSTGPRQLSTFYVSGRMYGIDVSSVQEVTKAMSITRVPLAPAYIHGLINLRGQIATAIGLRELFNLSESPSGELMNVVCREAGTLVALLVDSIGDVVEIGQEAFEPTPSTVSPQVGQYMQGVYKIPENLLSVLDVRKVVGVLNEEAKNEMKLENKSEAKHEMKV